MRICWRALVGYGFVFWIVLCITDLLGVTNVYKYSKELDELYEKPVVIQNIEKKLEPHLSSLEYKGIKFGWSLLVWNTVTFIFSIIVCSVGRSATWICWSLYRSYRNKIICAQLNSPSAYPKPLGSVSRIPVIVKSMSRSSDLNIQGTESVSKKIDERAEKSCPNLMLLKRSGSNLSTLTDVTTKTCRTLFKKDVYISNNPELSNETQLDGQCKKLKEELHRLQTTSLKEHAILSRKLDAVNKEKSDLIKRLTISQKENRAAKQQLEELLQEKSSLLNKLENATKEFKYNTKSKKYALAKLEEVTNNVEELRQQLEQVSRDKEILEKKLKLLETEYNKLHERYITSQERLYTPSRCNDENLPERDENSRKEKQMNPGANDLSDLELRREHNIPPAIQQTAEVLASVSQTELDMKKIQEKIKQLEKNLQKLNMEDNDLGYNRSLEKFESEISLSAMDNTSDSQSRIDESATNYSEFSGANSPRHKYWTDKVAELIGRNKLQFAKIQALASKMQEKARFLGNIRERTESTDELSTDSEEKEPKRLVSSSVAFKNFLKSLNRLDAAKRQFPSKPEVYF